MHHILIPTDFSINAWNAKMYAFQFFKNDPTTFHFLHVDVSNPLHNDKNLDTADFLSRKEINDNSKTEMEDLLQQVYKQNPNNRHKFKSLVVASQFIEGIRQYINTHKIDLILMGTKGGSGLKEMNIGSKTGAVITKVKCPILVIPEEAIFKTPRQLGFPTDFNLHYKSNVIKTLLAVTAVHNATLKVLRVAQNLKPLSEFQNSNRDYLKQSLAPVSHSFHVVENPNLENALQNFVSSFKIDMVAMIAKNLNFFQRILFKPKIGRMSYHMQIPFLVLH